MWGHDRGRGEGHGGAMAAAGAMAWAAGDPMPTVLNRNPDYLTLPLVTIGGGIGCLQMMMIIGRLSENIKV